MICALLFVMILLPLMHMSNFLDLSNSCSIVIKINNHSKANVIVIWIFCFQLLY
jgi:hypothetical protein